MLVTGAAGFIGHKVCQLLLEEDHEVIGLDNLNDYYDIRIKNYRIEKLKNYKQFKFIKADVESTEAVQAIFSSHCFQKVFHLAARAGVRNSLEMPHQYISTNVQGTLNILEQCKNKSVKNFILASTSSLYSGHQPPFNEDLVVNRPHSPYSASKGAAELLCHSYHHLYQLNASILRYFTVYGPMGRPDMAQFRFLHKIIQEQPLMINGDGTQSRDFTYVDDIARGTILASKLDGFHILNLGRGEKPVEINSMIKFIESKVGKKAIVIFSESNPADIYETYSSSEKSAKYLKWQPQVSFSEGLQTCINDYFQNQEFIKQLNI